MNSFKSYLLRLKLADLVLRNGARWMWRDRNNQHLEKDMRIKCWLIPFLVFFTYPILLLEAAREKHVKMICELANEALQQKLDFK